MISIFPPPVPSGASLRLRLDSPTAMPGLDRAGSLALGIRRAEKDPWLPAIAGHVAEPADVKGRWWGYLGNTNLYRDYIDI